MIEIHLKDYYKNTWSILMPHEINNEFLWNVWRAARDWKINWVYSFPFFWDFARVDFSPDKLDTLYDDYEILEQNLDAIIQIVPLPKEIWQFDIWFYPWFAVYHPSNINDLKIWLDERKKWNHLPYEEEKKNIFIDDPKPCTKEDILLLIQLTKKMILDAKEKNETLCFSWD
jgi:hypothetical protein